MMRRYEPAFLLVWTLITAALSFADVQHPIRTAFALSFVAVVPGLSITRTLRFGPMDRLLLAIPTSLSLAALISAVLVYSRYPSWDLGLSLMLAAAIGAIALDLAQGSMPGHPAARPSRTKLDDESRQARLINSLAEGSTLAEAADAAGVTTATLRRALHKSEQLRMAVRVVTHGQLVAADDATERPIDSRGLPPPPIST